MLTRIKTVAAAVAFSLTVPCLVVAGMYVYPSKGQSPQQVERDKGECYRWAVKQTGFDPAAPPAPSSPPPANRAPEGGVLRGAARGAALGAIGGAIAGDAGKGAAIGAATGGLFGGMRRHDSYRRQQQEHASWQQQEAARINHMKAEYERAYKACLQGRGYTIN